MEAECKPYDQIILFGDSITQMSSSQESGFGLQPALQDAYIRRLDVINRGFSGYTTAHAVKVFQKFFPKLETARVQLMTILFGANDACLPGNAQYVPLPTFKTNLKTIIQHPATQAQTPRILLLTPTPINEYQVEGFDASKGNAHPSRTASHTRQYADAVREVGGELGVAVVDLWGAFMRVAGWDEGKPLDGSKEVPENEKLAGLLTDGLHLTAEGYRVVFGEVMGAVRRNWPELEPERMPMVFPGWVEAPM
ncbi:hypothetical protein PHISP_01184 [Aspergillus sp. HF37]|nr:hypothetical protein PHISP_01184 [Aspergillus sp. HF37]